MALGLVQIAKQSFSSVTNVDFNNVFDSLHKQYLIVLNCYATLETNLNARLISGGSVNSSTIYNLQDYETGTGIGASRSTSRTDWASIGLVSGGYGSIQCTFEILNPYQTMYTTAIGGRLKFPYVQGDTAIDEYTYGTNVTTSFDGIRIYGANNFSGSITIYGYRF